MKVQGSPENWFKAAVHEAEKGTTAWRNGRVYMITAGFFFCNARDLCAHGDWGKFLDAHKGQCHPRTVWRYMQFAEAALQWAKADKEGCKLTGQNQIRFAIENVRLMSPVPMTNLLRELNEMRGFGEYDAIKHAKRHLPRQVEFNFVSVSDQIDLLTHLDEPNYSWKFPEGTDEPGALNGLKAKLETVIEKIDAQLRARTTIET